MSDIPHEQGERDLRGLLFSIAHEMLGEVGDAEDVVQEAYLRLHRLERDGGVVQSRRRS